MARSISNSEDVIDSRDIIERIDELTSAKEDAEAHAEQLQGEIDELEGEEEPDADKIEAIKDELASITETAENGTTFYSSDDFSEDEYNELRILEELAEEASGYASDWTYGESLIRDSYFQEYAQQMAEDIGAIDKSASWPNTCIDWEKAAEELQQDYTSVEFDGVTYWVR